MTILEIDSRMLSTLMDLAVPRPHAVANDNGTRRVRINPEPENQSRRVDAFDPNTNGNVALLPEEDSDDDDMLNLMTNMGYAPTSCTGFFWSVRIISGSGALKGES